MRFVAIVLLVLGGVSFVACSDEDNSAEIRDFIATNFPQPITPTAGPAGPGGPETPPAISGEPTVQPDGLQIFLIRAGQGDTAEPGMRVFIQYTGWLEDGTKFLSTLDAGPPISVVMGRGNLPEGLEEGIAGMKVGEKRRLIVPPELGYGEEGFGSVPPNATLTFDIELVDVEQE